MTISIASFDRDAKAIDVAEALRRDGAAIVRELVAADVMDSLTSKLATELDAQEPGGGSFFGHRMKILTRLFARGPEFAEHLMLNQRVLEVTDAILRPQFPMTAPSQERPIATADASDTPLEQLFGSRDPVLGPHCHHYRVNVGVALQVCGGGKNQPLHREMDIHQPFLKHDPTRPEAGNASWISPHSTRNPATSIGLRVPLLSIGGAERAKRGRGDDLQTKLRDRVAAPSRRCRRSRRRRVRALVRSSGAPWHGRCSSRGVPCSQPWVPMFPAIADDLCSFPHVSPQRKESNHEEKSHPNYRTCCLQRDRG